MLSKNIVLDKDHLEHVVKEFSKQGAFVFDVETLGPNRGVPTQNEVVWMALASKGMAVSIPFGHPNGDVLLQKESWRKDKETGLRIPIPVRYDAPPPQLRPSQVFDAIRPLFFSDRVKIAHNAPFDLLSVHKYFGELPPPPYRDTIVEQWLVNENLMSLGLKNLTKSEYKVDYDKENVGRKIELHPFSKVAHYAFMDSRYEWLHDGRLMPILEAEGLLDVFALEMDVLAVLLDMGVEGALMDVPQLEALRDELSVTVVEAEAGIYKAAGKMFNINSPQQKVHILFDPKSEGGQGLKPKKLTKGGRKKERNNEPILITDYSTDADVLDSYNNKVTQALIDYAEVNKLLGTYVLGYLGVEGDPDKPCRIFNGKVHADFVQYGTVTGRFSCREPNLQNIPTPTTDLGKKIRGLFIAPPGHKLVVSDYSAIEMVILAHFIGKGALYDGLMAGLDPHTATAAAVYKIKPEDVTPAKRQVAKGLNFAIIYGAGPEKVAKLAGITEREAKRFLETHQEVFPEIYRFKDRVLATCRSREPVPYIKTILGRKRRLPGITSNRWTDRGYAERQAVNSLIQGSAADLIKLAMVRLNRDLPLDMHLILTIHDELIVVAPDGRTDLCAQIMREAMLGEDIQELIKVPLKSDLKVVSRWAEAKE